MWLGALCSPGPSPLGLIAEVGRTGLAAEPGICQPQTRCPGHGKNTVVQYYKNKTVTNTCSVLSAVLVWPPLSHLIFSKTPSIVDITFFHVKSQKTEALFESLRFQTSEQWILTLNPDRLRTKVIPQHSCLFHPRVSEWNHREGSETGLPRGHGLDTASPRGLGTQGRDSVWGEGAKVTCVHPRHCPSIQVLSHILLLS